jgi:adenylosuccinate synthase
LLDVNFGTYPFVTSSNTIASGSCVGLGISPRQIRDVYGVFKAYATRVGEGPFLTEQINSTGEKLMTAGNEYGSTTGRPRRCGWLDLVALRYSIMLNGATKLVITKPDVLSCVPEVKVCTHYMDHNGNSFGFTDAEALQLKPVYEILPSWKQDISVCKSYDELPSEIQSYLDYIEQQLALQINIVSVGPDRVQTIHR